MAKSKGSAKSETNGKKQQSPKNPPKGGNKSNNGSVKDIPKSDNNSKSSKAGKSQKSNTSNKQGSSSSSKLVWISVLLISAGVAASGVFFSSELKDIGEQILNDFIHPQVLVVQDYINSLQNPQEEGVEDRQKRDVDENNNIQSDDEDRRAEELRKEKERQKEEERKRAEKKRKEEEEARKEADRKERERLDKVKKEEERKKKEEEKKKEAERKEKERLEKLRQEEERKKKEAEERREKERREQEKKEAERKEKEKQEALRKEAERKEKEKKEAERKEKERLEKLRQEEEKKKKEAEERKEAEKIEKEKKEAERKEKERVEAEKKEKERKVREEAERKEKERKEKEEAERKEKERKAKVEAEKKEKERKEKQEAERKEKERKEKEEAEKKEKERKEKQEAERKEKERKEKEEAERKEKERKEKEEAERKEKERKEKEKERKEREEAERKEKERKEKEAALKKEEMKKQQEKEKKEQERIEKERKEQEKKEKERKDKEKKEAELKEKERKEALKKEQEKEEAERKEKEQKEALRKKEEEKKKEAERREKEMKKKEEETKRKEEEKREALRKEDERKSYVKAAITNVEDMEIRKELDEADALLEAENFEAAIKKFDEILNGHPNSPRATYGKGLTLDKLGFKHMSNDYLEQSINFLDRVLSLKLVPDDLVKMCGRKLAERQQFRGWGAKGVKTYKILVQRFPDDLKLLNEFGVQYLLIGQNERAREVFKDVLKKNPNSGFAKAHLGFILRTADNDLSRAIPLLKEGIASGEEGTSDGRFYVQLGDALLRVGKEEDARHYFREAEEKGLFLSQWQRSLYNVKELTGKPFWTPEQAGYKQYTKILEENWQTIRDEGLAQLNVTTGAFIPEDENLRDTGDWKQLTLYSQGRKNKDNCARTPKTCALIDQMPEARGCRRGQVKFSVMSPGIHVWPHTGPTNCRLRGHLGLVVPEGPTLRVVKETRTWKEGEMFIFDDSFEHEVWHIGSELRLILIVDFWHPELTEKQRKTLTPI